MNGADEDVITDSGHRKRHLGVDFAMWRSEGAWFWLLINASGEGGTIGASANEAQALRDACLSIEEILTVSDESPNSSATRIPLKTTSGSEHAVNQRRY